WFTSLLPVTLTFILAAKSAKVTTASFLSFIMVSLLMRKVLFSTVTESLPLEFNVPITRTLLVSRLAVSWVLTALARRLSSATAILLSLVVASAEVAAGVAWSSLGAVRIANSA